jgi:tRNA-uridine 2-sulfurtransferase
MLNERKKVIVGLSGGVDSSVAAYLLLQQGYHVEGLFMKNWEDNAETCTAAKDYADAQSVCEKLSIPLHTANFSERYWQQVFTHFLNELRRGRTPNPDILCNKEIKFTAFLEHALALGADYIATGHYAKIQYADNYYQLLKSVDHNKDQTYFLYTLNQQQLRHSLFPIGELCKPDVRQIAKKLGLLNAQKKDSTGICFIGEKRFKHFLSDYLPAKPGKIYTLDGTLIGQHDGLMYYTIGQRKGLGIGGIANTDEKPWYVLEKDLKRNVLIVGQGESHPQLYRNTLTCDTLDWIRSEIPALPLHCHAKTRYRQPDQACTLQGIQNNELIVTFDQPQRAITPGQSIVFYQAHQCLGGGIIT